MFRQLCLAVAVVLATPTQGIRKKNKGSDRVGLHGGPKKTHLAVLMRTGGNSSPSRVESIRKTWAQDLEDDALTLLQPDSECRSTYGDNHWKGLTCLEAKNELQFMNRTDFEWLLVVDDDVFVFVDRLRGTLRGMDPSKAAVYGAPFCGECGIDGRKGFCGGGGYVLSRQSLLKMASATEAPVSAEKGGAFVQMMMSEPNIGWCDVRFGCVAQEQGLEAVNVKGMYGNGIIDSAGKFDLAEETKVVELDAQYPPLVLHVIRDDKHMKRLYEESRKQIEQAETPTKYSVDGEPGHGQQWSFLQLLR